MSEGNLPVNLSHATSIDTIWDFEIQGIENEASLPLTGENSDDCGSPSASALSTAPSGLLTPTLGSNTADRSSYVTIYNLAFVSFSSMIIVTCACLHPYSPGNLSQSAYPYIKAIRVKNHSSISWP